MNDKNKIKYSKAYKITKNKDDNDLINAKEYFEKPDKFLEINPKIVVGLSPDRTNHNQIKEKIKTISSLETENTRKNNQDNVISSLTRNNYKNHSDKNIINNHRILTEEPLRIPSIQSYEEKKGNTSKNNGNGNLISSKKLSNVHSKDNINSIHFQYKSFKDLQQIFRDSIRREKLYKSKGTNYLMPTEVNSYTKKKYFSQEKKLKFNEEMKANEKEYFKNLAKKCKKDENDLLIKNIEDFRLKKQLKDYAENDKILSEKFGDNYWLFSLRRAEKNDFLRLDYYNVGNNKREIWKRFVDYPDKDVELINAPYIQTKNKMPILLKFNKSYKGKISKMPNIKGISEIKIEGKNLVLKEYKDIIDIIHSYKSNCKFKIYKDPKEKKSNYVNNFTCREVYNYKDNKTRSAKKNYNLIIKKKKNLRYSSK
jgi:hypothetical protein